MNELKINKIKILQKGELRGHIIMPVELFVYLAEQNALP